jgi:hypothetical protein
VEFSKYLIFLGASCDSVDILLHMMQISLGTVGQSIHTDREKNIIGINKNYFSLLSKILCKNVLARSDTERGYLNIN